MVNGDFYFFSVIGEFVISIFFACAAGPVRQVSVQLFRRASPAAGLESWVSIRLYRKASPAAGLGPTFSILVCIVETCLRQAQGSRFQYTYLRASPVAGVDIVFQALLRRALRDSFQYTYISELRLRRAGLDRHILVIFYLKSLACGGPRRVTDFSTLVSQSLTCGWPKGSFQYASILELEPRLWWAQGGRF